MSGGKLFQTFMTRSVKKTDVVVLLQYQKLLKSDNPSSRYSRKCRVCFLRHSVFSKVLEAVMKIWVLIDKHALIQTRIEVTYCLMGFKNLVVEPALTFL